MMKVSGKFKHPVNRTIKKDVKIVLHRHPFMDKTNMLQVPSNKNKAQKRKDTKNNENRKDTKETQPKYKIVSENSDDESQKGSTKSLKTGDEYAVRTLTSDLRSNEDVGAKMCYKLHQDPKFKLQCVVRLEKFDMNKLGVKLPNDLKNVVQEVQSTNKVCQKNSLICTNKSNHIVNKVSEGNGRTVLSKKICKEDKLLTKPEIIPAINRSTLPKRLRKQVKKNYAELSLDKSQGVALPNPDLTKKVPIYKSQQSGDTKPKGRTDVYEFDDFDTDGVKNRKKRDDVNNSEKFDKSMHNILQKIELKEAKLQAKNKRKVIKEVGSARKRRKPLQGNTRKVKRKVAILNNPANNNPQGNAGKCSMNVNNVENIPVHGNKPHNETGRSCILKSSKNVQNLENMSERELRIPNVNSTTEVPEDDSGDDSGEFFDFGEVQHSTPVKINPKINIINNIVLKEIDSPNLFDNLRPNANSTMLSSDKRSPWRFNENLKRNPHFITLKRSAMPCLHQDMVLDYVQLEKSERLSKSERKIETPKKKLVQKSIMDFMNVSPGNVSNKENIPHSSLFDNDEFSPKKIKLPCNVLKNNAKRNILGPRQDNSENILANMSTRNRIILGEKSLTGMTENNKENDDVSTYFGFDDDTEVVLAENRSKASEAKPYRIKQPVRKKPTKEAAATDLVVPDLTDLPESPDSQTELDGKEVGLFEDPEQLISLNMPSKIYQRKRRRKRLLSVDADEEEAPQKKKNMMTKQEEDELEKWAAQFNSECAEIEKYELDIE